METPPARRRRALVTQNHMVELSGSEILTLELAEELDFMDALAAVVERYAPPGR